MFWYVLFEGVVGGEIGCVWVVEVEWYVEVLGVVDGYVGVEFVWWG